jgi:hypothetical protein
MISSFQDETTKDQPLDLFPGQTLRAGLAWMLHLLRSSRVNLSHPFLDLALPSRFFLANHVAPYLRFHLGNRHYPAMIRSNT